MKNKPSIPSAPGYPKVDLERKRWLKTIDGKRISLRLVDEISRPQSNVPNLKWVCLQKLQHDADKRIEYRFTYYMKSPKVNRWVFGQYSLMIPAKDLKWLLKEARKRKWEGF
jgi:hypothetical protein